MVQLYPALISSDLRGVRPRFKGWEVFIVFQNNVPRAFEVATVNLNITGDV
jgi:hypothetical protein